MPRYSSSHAELQRPIVDLEATDLERVDEVDTVVSADQGLGAWVHDHLGNGVMGAFFAGQPLGGLEAWMSERWDCAFEGRTDASSNTAVQRLMRRETVATSSLTANLPRGGAPLPEQVRTRMESAFRHDFSDVRVHFGSSASQAADALQAHAFALGAEIFFAAGQFAPGTPAGDRLLAHELTHVVQFHDGRLPTSSESEVSSPSDPSELEAYRNEDRILGELSRQPVAAPETVAPTASSPSGTVISRDAAIEPGTADEEGVEEGPKVFRSPDSSIDGRTVEDVGADARARLQRYREITPNMRSYSENTQNQELDWYAKKGLLGDFIDLYNDHSPTDPSRWAAVLDLWGVAQSKLDAALAIPVSEGTINAIGGAAKEALEAFEAARNLDERCSSQFAAYLEGYTDSAGNVLLGATIAQDLIFFAALVVLAPAVAGTMAAGVAELGVTGAAAKALTAGTTVLAMGELGAALEGGTRAVAAVGVEGCELLDQLLAQGKSWEQAVDAFDWSVVQREGWSGMKRGFVDGALAYAGLQFEALAGGAMKVALARALGETSGSIVSAMLRRAAERAVAAGASGAVVGALNAGAKAAIDGGTLDQVLAATEEGFVIGAIVGTTLGTLAGAYGGYREAASDMARLLRADPDAFVERFNEMVTKMTPEERAMVQIELEGRLPAPGSGSTVSETARLLEQRSVTGQPITVAELEATVRPPPSEAPPTAITEEMWTLGGDTAEMSTTNAIGDTAEMEIVAAADDASAAALAEAPAGFGTAQAAEHAAGKGAAMAGEWASLGLEARAARLEGLVNDQLRSAGIPTLPLVADKSIRGACFGHSQWEIRVAEARLTGNPTPEALADLVSDVAHEARHAEQWFQIARLRAGEGQQLGQIQRELGIPIDVADDALKQPLTASDPAYAEAVRWNESVYGAGAVERNRILTALDTKSTQLQAAVDLVEERTRAYAAAFDTDPSGTATHINYQSLTDAVDAERAIRVEHTKTYDEYLALPEEVDARVAGDRTREAYEDLVSRARDAEAAAAAETP